MCEDPASFDANVALSLEQYAFEQCAQPPIPKAERGNKIPERIWMEICSPRGAYLASLTFKVVAPEKGFVLTAISGTPCYHSMLLPLRGQTLPEVMLQFAQWDVSIHHGRSWNDNLTYTSIVEQDESLKP